MSPWESANVELDILIGLFYDDPLELGDFTVVDAEDVPEPARSLLDHDHHMTVTLEKYHSAPVTVEVLREQRQGHFYSREILLHRVSDHAVVQYGMVRLNLEFLDQPVQQEILCHVKPLGRILIDHDVLRRVKSKSLLRIEPGPVLIRHLNIDVDSSVFGRTAIIFTDTQPAIELLEIVTAV